MVNSPYTSFIGYRLRQRKTILKRIKYLIRS